MELIGREPEVQQLRLFIARPHPGSRGGASAVGRLGSERPPCWIKAAGIAAGSGIRLLRATGAQFEAGHLLRRPPPAPPPVLHRAAPPEPVARPGSERGAGAWAKDRRPRSSSWPARSWPSCSRSPRSSPCCSSSTTCRGWIAPAHSCSAWWRAASAGLSGGPPRGGPDRPAQLLRPGQPARRARGAAVGRGGGRIADQPLSRNDTAGAAAAARRRPGQPLALLVLPRRPGAVPSPEPFPPRCLWAVGCRRSSPPKRCPRRSTNCCSWPSWTARVICASSGRSPPTGGLEHAPKHQPRARRSRVHLA